MRGWDGITRRGIGLTLLLLVAACTGATTTTDNTAPETADTSPGTTQQASTTTESTTSALTSGVLSELASELEGWGVSEDSITCIQDGLLEGGYLEDLDDVGFVDLLFVDETDPLSEVPPELAYFVEGFLFYLTDPQEGCLRPAELTAVFENLSIEGEDTGFSSYGDDPVLDELYDGCVAGSLADCDMLFMVSDFGSEYEDMAISCGGLVEDLGLGATCMTAMQDFSEADDLAAQCEEGFYIACDAYFVVTVIGSAEEALAASCGGIREPNLTTPCWIAYGLGSRP